MAALSGPYLRFSSSLVSPLCSTVAVDIWLTLGLATSLVAGTKYLSKPTQRSGVYFGLLFERSIINIFTLYIKQILEDSGEAEADGPGMAAPQ